MFQHGPTGTAEHMASLMGAEDAGYLFGDERDTVTENRLRGFRDGAMEIYEAVQDGL